MNEYKNKQWQDLTQEEQIGFLSNATINVSKEKAENGEYRGLLAFKDLWLACTADEDNNVHIKNTSRFRTKQEVENYTENANNKLI